ncbi:MAG: hypothetical protein PHN36_02990 [Patescibacteria group bacterium]|nr:hypothetical protein [Patescibacteria group bacterium]
MSKKWKLILKLWSIFIIIIILVFLFWLFWKNSISSGHLMVVNDFCQSATYSVIFFPQQKFISNLYPGNRVADVEIDDLGRCFQRIISEPAYFKIILPRKFIEAKLKIYYQNQGQNVLQIGMGNISQGLLDWAFQIQNIENHTIKPKVTPAISGDLKVGQAKFLITSDFDAGRQLEFILSAPDLSKNQGQIRIYKIEAELIREPLTWHTFFNTGLNFWQKFLNKFK